MKDSHYVGVHKETGVVYWNVSLAAMIRAIRSTNGSAPEKWLVYHVRPSPFYLEGVHYGLVPESEYTTVAWKA